MWRGQDRLCWYQFSCQIESRSLQHQLFVSHNTVCKQRKWCSEYNNVAKSPIPCCLICDICQRGLVGSQSSIFKKFPGCVFFFTSTCPVAQVKRNGVGGNMLLTGGVCRAQSCRADKIWGLWWLQLFKETSLLTGYVAVQACRGMSSSKCDHVWIWRAFWWLVNRQ